MKITDFKDELKMEGIKIFKPIQYLSFHINNYDLSKTNIRARIINTTTGKTDEIIPNMKLKDLAEIASRNEGFFVDEVIDRVEGTAAGDVKFENNATMTAVGIFNVMLHPTCSVGLSNDRYLEVDIYDLGQPTQIGDRFYTSTCAVYGLENHKIDNDFAMKYRKFYMAAGEQQKAFVVGDNEDLILPNDDSLQEIQLYFKDGSYSPVYLLKELQTLQLMHNDIVCDSKLKLTGRTQIGYSQTEYGFINLLDVDVEGVENINIKRVNSLKSFEFFMLDMVSDSKK